MSVVAVVFFVWVATSWAAARILIVNVGFQRADAAFVLSGAPVYFERVAYAARLFAERRAASILLTDDGVRGSWSRTLQRNPLYYERAVLRLTQAGVPPASIEILEGPIASTHDEAVLLRQYAETHALRSVIVVTSQYHTRRALWTIRQALKGTRVEVGIEPADAGPNTPPPATWWLHISGWRAVGGEYVKLPYYWLRYW
jgi:uncharacterized SAM-binding protein YcdF (DUF218 family)